MVHVLRFAVFVGLLATVLSDVAVRGLPFSQCTSNKQCKSDNSFCHIDKPCYQGTCACKTGFTLSYNISSEIGDCVKNKKLGGTCGWLRGGCVGNLECDLGPTQTTYSTGTCKCPYGTTADGDSWCMGSKAPGEQCGVTTPSHDSSDWACKAFNDYYKDDKEALSQYQPQSCVYNGTHYRCTCNPTFYKTNAAGTACEKKEFASNGQECNVTSKPCDPDVAGLPCNPSVTPNVCQCPPPLTIRTYTGKDGAQKQMCAHANAVLEVQSGYECDDSNADPAKHMYCEWPLVCGTCPEDVTYGVKLCMSGSAGMTFNVVVLVLSIILSQ